MPTSLVNILSGLVWIVIRGFMALSVLSLVAFLCLVYIEKHPLHLRNAFELFRKLTLP